MQKFWCWLSIFIVGAAACTKSNKSSTSTPAVQAVTAEQTLSKLNVIADNLDPAFDPMINQYTLAGGETRRNKISINTAPVDPNVQITVNGVKLRSDFTTDPLPLAAGQNIFSIDLIDSSGVTINSYKLTVQRVQDLQDEYLDDIAVSNGDLTPAFAPDVTSYQLTVDKNTTVLTVSPLASYPDEAQFEIDGTLYSADKGGYDVTINPGASTITITVKGRSGRSKTYTIAVTRPNA